MLTKLRKSPNFFYLKLIAAECNPIKCGLVGYYACKKHLLATTLRIRPINDQEKLFWDYLRKFTRIK